MCPNWIRSWSIRSPEEAEPHVRDDTMKPTEIVVFSPAVEELKFSIGPDLLPKDAPRDLEGTKDGGSEGNIEMRLPDAEKS